MYLDSDSISLNLPTFNVGKINREVHNFIHEYSQKEYGEKPYTKWVKTIIIY